MQIILKKNIDSILILYQLTLRMFEGLKNLKE